MEKIDEAVEKIKKFVSEKGKLTVMLCTIFILLFICGIIAMIVQCATKPRKVQLIPEVQPSISTDSLIPPEYGSLTEDYYFSRISSDKWSPEDVDRWFTEPTDSAIDNLESANDALVNDITGAAP
jgi:hypothetical protein